MTKIYLINFTDKEDFIKNYYKKYVLYNYMNDCIDDYGIIPYMTFDADMSLRGLRVSGLLYHIIEMAKRYFLENDFALAVVVEHVMNDYYKNKKREYFLLTRKDNFNTYYSISEMNIRKIGVNVKWGERNIKQFSKKNM